ncbi:ABC transporter permease [Clostridium fungisolvens]|uniref:ABC3 transporter permease C-terminal domain-containing protein n=1 Tax=Clostridium fungisolvens TaxID=1604897 RepID=A0A6V8SKP4_9CLOT|nr:FtsX-like permease family protein [Clostridium fungisolvens]GFP77737.1 hypothetical protein bsdtw1_03908 [Clostridium fungisolvens]
MSIFSKYIFKSIVEKKGRAILLLISIALSAALLIASLSSIKSLVNTMSQYVRGNYGEFNVQINADNTLEEPLFDAKGINNKDISKSFKALTIGGYVGDTENEFDLIGTSLSDFTNFSSLKLLDKSNLEPFEGKKLIVSQKTSDLLKVKVGDEIKLNILGKEEAYKIAAITDNSALFSNDIGNKFTLITPIENVSKIYSSENKISIMFASVDSKDINGWINNFNKAHEGEKIVASPVYDEVMIEGQLNSLKMPLFFMLGIVLIMTIFIIYSSFKLIIAEKLPTIGTFLSQGATKGGVIKILMLESFSYGILGGGIGVFWGEGIAYLICYYSNPLKAFGVKADFRLYVPYVLIGFIFAVVLSMISSILPIVSIRKLSVKDIILNTLATSNKPSNKGFILGVLLLIVAVAFHMIGKYINYFGAVISILFALVGVLLILPKFVDTVLYPIVNAFRNMSGLTMLSLNNVRTSRVLINNIRLLIISIVSIVMINSLKISLVDVVRGAYNGSKYDISISVNSNNSKAVNQIINSYDGIKDINETGIIATNLAGDNSKKIYVFYVNPNKFKTFENYLSFDDKDKQLDALEDDDDGIVLSRQMALRYGINAGDTITLTLNNKDEKFKVLSIYNAKMMQNGNYNLISEKAALKHFNIKYPTQYFVTTNSSQEEAKKILTNKLRGLDTTVFTKDENILNNEQNNAQVVNILSIFSYMTIIIAVFGVMSNISISFIQRKREMAVISSIGLTTAGRGVVILLESIFQALLSIVVALITSVGINVLMGDVFKFLTLDLTLQYPINLMAIISVVVLIIMVIASLSSVFRSKKLQLISELKYE